MCEVLSRRTVSCTNVRTRGRGRGRTGGTRERAGTGGAGTTTPGNTGTSTGAGITTPTAPIRTSMRRITPRTPRRPRHGEQAHVSGGRGITTTIIPIRGGRRTTISGDPISTGTPMSRALIRMTSTATSIPTRAMGPTTGGIIGGASGPMRGPLLPPIIIRSSGKRLPTRVTPRMARRPTIIRAPTTSAPTSRPGHIMFHRPSAGSILSRLFPFSSAPTGPRPGTHRRRPTTTRRRGGPHRGGGERGGRGGRGGRHGGGGGGTIRRGRCRFSNVLANINILRVVPSKCNFLHSSSCGCLASPSSVCMSRSRVGLFNLGANSIIRKTVHPPGRNRGCFPLIGISGVGNHAPRRIHSHIPFSRLAPLFPSRGFVLATHGSSGMCSGVTMHMMSLFSPVNGKRHNLVITRPGANGAVLLGSVTGTVTTGRPRICVVVLLVSRHPRRIASVTHDMSTRIVTSAFSRPTRHRIGVTRVMLGGTGHVIRYKRSIIVLLSSVAHLTHTCGAIRPTSNGILSNNISTGTLRGPGHFFKTTHGVRGNNDLAVLTATLARANSGVSSIVFRRFGNANGVRLRLSHGLTGGHICPTISVATSDAHHSSLLRSRGAIGHV